MKQWSKLAALAPLSILLAACSMLDSAPPARDAEPAAPDAGAAVTQSAHCSGTAQSCAGEAVAAAADSDRDGVADALDRCADTPPGQAVGADGCSECNALLAIVTNLNFEFDRAALTQQAAAKLEPITATLLDNPAINVSVEGHTDSVGAAAYNEALSERRASSVVDFMAGQGVARERMTPLGLGESMPLVANASPAGRAVNRRVEFRVACAA